FGGIWRFTPRRRRSDRTARRGPFTGCRACPERSRRRSPLPWQRARDQTHLWAPKKLRREYAARLVFWSIPDDPRFFPNVSLYRDPALCFARLSQIESKLHSHQVLHLRPKRLLDPQAHLTRKRRFPVQQAQSACRPTPRTFAASVTVSPSGS